MNKLHTESELNELTLIDSGEIEVLHQDDHLIWDNDQGAYVAYRCIYHYPTKTINEAKFTYDSILNRYGVVIGFQKRS